MTNLTISLEDEIIEKANRVANLRSESLDELVRGFIHHLAAQDDDSRSRAVEALEHSFESLSRPMGGVDWKDREELHER